MFHLQQYTIKKEKTFMKSYISFLLIVITFSAFSQNVGISATSSFTPNVSAMLDIDVSSLGATAKKGFGFPSVRTKGAGVSTTNGICRSGKFPG